jgi:hypothetical protein
LLFNLYHFDNILLTGNLAFLGFVDFGGSEDIDFARDLIHKHVWPQSLGLEKVLIVLKLV